MPSGQTQLLTGTPSALIRAADRAGQPQGSAAAVPFQDSLGSGGGQDVAALDDLLPSRRLPCLPWRVPRVRMPPALGALWSPIRCYRRGRLPAALPASSRQSPRDSAACSETTAGRRPELTRPAPSHLVYLGQATSVVQVDGLQPGSQVEAHRHVGYHECCEDLMHMVAELPVDGIRQPSRRRAGCFERVRPSMVP